MKYNLIHFTAVVFHPDSPDLCIRVSINGRGKTIIDCTKDAQRQARAYKKHLTYRLEKPTDKNRLW